jgi:hypothetical protein
MRRIPILAIVGLLAMLTACASFQSTAGKSLASIALTADASMKGWAQWVAAGQVAPDQEAKVKAAYEKYQAAMTLAKTAYANAAVSGDQTGWQAAYDLLTQNQAALIAIVQSFTTATPKAP